jgi:hypothetical protein
VKRLAADRSRWKSFVEALCSYTGDNRKWWWWWRRRRHSAQQRSVVSDWTWSTHTTNTVTCS